MNNPTLRYGILTFGIAIILTCSLGEPENGYCPHLADRHHPGYILFRLRVDKAIAGSKITVCQRAFCWR